MWICKTCGKGQINHHLVDTSGGLGWGSMDTECLSCERNRFGLGKVMTLVECGCCGGYHPSDFEGDCRDDQNRFANEDDFEERMGYPVGIQFLEEVE